MKGGYTAPALANPAVEDPYEANTHAIPGTPRDAESFTSITNITANKYSISTNENYNINIAINSSNTESGFTSGTSQLSNSTSCLSKSSCYISNTSPEPNITKTFGGSLGDFSSQDGTRFTRTRVSIPPSSRNRDRSARPESFRLSSDMASHTRVLLKARSFAGASLRESLANKHRKGREYSRSSLREDHLSYYKEKDHNQHRSFNKVKFQRTKFATPCENPSDIVSQPISQCDKSEVVLQTKTRNFNKEQPAEVDFHQLQTTSIKETNIVIINTLTKRDTVCHERSQEHASHEATTTTGREFRDLISSQRTEPHRKPYSRSSYVASPSTVTENELLPKYKTNVIITDSGSERDSMDFSRAQMLRARSFTGLMTPRGTSPSPSPTRESLRGTATPSFIKVPLGENCDRLLQVTPGTRRVRALRDGKALRFSSDLGFGARPKSKREVFV
ncbi:hypothetical protein GWK47_016040 [Chionoecetes opilio]|uniref:Uncharacterized protein n=1 Tax=Chionoecetes opilio TaxID=41210 RepID=A0A8J4XRZ3_CHIOP|nr:hypothetical protein GWK47_016040 [Chionoecetes opilio]